MKHITILILSLLLLTVGCVEDRKTIANTKEAATVAYSEMFAYEAFAQRALQDSVPSVANLFNSLAKSAKIHSELLKDRLTADLNIKNFKPLKHQAAIDSSLSNLYNALANEQYDHNNLYPLFEKQATVDQQPQIEQLFNIIARVKATNIRLLNQMISTLSQSVDSTQYINQTYFTVCQQCGNILAKEQTQCDICQ